MGSAEEAADLRILFSDAEENTREIVWEEDTNRISADAKVLPKGADLTSLPLMGTTNKSVNERGRIILEAKGHAPDTVESEDCGGEIPIILRHKRTGRTYKKILKVGDVSGAFRGFLATADVVLNTSSFVKLGHYVVPDGYTATLDGSRQVHVYLGDDT